MMKTRYAEAKRLAIKFLHRLSRMIDTGLQARESFWKKVDSVKANLWQKRRYWFAVLVILIIVHAAVTVVLGRQVSSALKDIQKKGDPVTVTDSGSPNIPDEKNAAIIYRQISDILAPSYRMNRSSNITTLLHKLRENPQDNALRQQAEKTVKQYENILPLVRTAVSRPYCAFSRRSWGGRRRYSSRRFYGTYELVSYLGLKAALDVENGREQEAIECCRLAFQVGESLTRDTSTSSLSVSFGIINASFGILQDIIERSDLDAEQCISFADYLGQIDFMPVCVRVARTERAAYLRVYNDPDWRTRFLINSYARHASGPTGSAAQAGAPAAPNRTSPGETGSRYGYYPQPLSLQDKAAIYLVNSFVWKPVLYFDELAYLRVMDRTINEIEIPSHKSPKSGKPETYSQVTPVLAAISPNYDWIRRMRDYAAVQISISRAALYLAAYKDRFGHYPESLPEMQKRLGCMLSGDPLTGKPVVYKRQGQGFTVYSVGWNAEDDGGAGRTQDRRPVDDIGLAAYGKADF